MMYSLLLTSELALSIGDVDPEQAPRRASKSAMQPVSGTGHSFDLLNPGNGILLPGDVHPGRELNNAGNLCTGSESELMEDNLPGPTLNMNPIEMMPDFGLYRLADDSALCFSNAYWDVNSSGSMALTSISNMGINGRLPVSAPRKGVVTRLQPAPGFLCGHEVRSQWLQSYINEEQHRCIRHQTLDPCDTFLSQLWLHEISQATPKPYDGFLKIWVGICSASSVVALQETLTTLKTEDSVQLYAPLHELSRAERFLVIERTEHQITSLALLKRCHALKLWEDHCAFVGYDHRWNVMDASHGFDHKGPGNPQIIAKSRATKALVKSLCPDVEETSKKFIHTWKRIKTLEKLGKRLCMLTETYGRGVLGLMQCSDRAPPNISDQMFVQRQASNFHAANNFIGFCRHLTLNLNNFFSNCTEPRER